jgi:hypothetical protein
MNLTGLLQDALSGDTVSQISQQIGADEGSTSSAIQAALPMLLGGLAQNSSTEQGAASLFGALDKDHDGSALDDLAGLIGGGTAASAGAGILGHIFGGSQDNVAQGVSQASGLDMSKVGPLLAILAPVVMGAIGKTQRQQGLGAGDLAGLLGGATQSMSSGSPMLDMLSGMLDKNHDGSAVDDVMGMIGGFLGGKK